ncbi:Crp/Fnr family transcriptional regulator [Echinicola strongylocentroti]|uniref:Crp/Fnr family transcriptional regulator n=1 Tax=Echinicola strongylocentroti TaxID=1795355 RepID=A0A2Z4IN03_9BACT|nr:Crp/Fnr family transcriptional regulator [Echinicola strongylocentroti]AWW32008.1 Crp/Fnr family transcriptional regulator [Echinicola strongylocentroti]
MAIPIRPNNDSYMDFNFHEHIINNYPTESIGKVREMVIKKNDYIYDPSSKHSYLYEILEGAVKLGSYKEDGEEFTFDVVFKNDFFGDLKYLNSQFFEHSKALIDTRVRVYDREFFKQMVIQKPHVSEWFISYVVKRWCSAEKKLKKLNEKRASERLIFLNSFFDIQVMDIHNTPYSLLDLLTQKDLGDMMGMTRQTVANISRGLFQEI